jgi:hypothetical protein
MTTFNHYAGDQMAGLIATIERFADAGIDPAFDSDLEELEREFAELRLNPDHN